MCMINNFDTCECIFKTAAVEMPGETNEILANEEIK